MRINYKSDFKLNLGVKFADGQTADMSLYDFDVKVMCGDRKYAAGKSGTTWTNCKWDAEKKLLTVMCDGHGLMPGRLKAEVAVKVPDSDFADGTWLRCSVVTTDVYLVPGNGEDVEADAEGIIGQAIIIAQEEGDSESKVMSQKAVTEEYGSHLIPDFLLKLEMTQNGSSDTMNAAATPEILRQNGWTAASLLSYLKRYKNYMVHIAEGDVYVRLTKRDIAYNDELSADFCYNDYDVICGLFFGVQEESLAVIVYKQYQLLGDNNDDGAREVEDADVWRKALNLQSGSSGSEPDYSETAVVLGRKWINGAVIHEKTVYTRSEDGMKDIVLTSPDVEGSVDMLLGAKMVIKPDMVNGVVYNQTEPITETVENNITKMCVRRQYNADKQGTELIMNHNGKFTYDGPGLSEYYFRFAVVIQYILVTKL